MKLFNAQCIGTGKGQGSPKDGVAYEIKPSTRIFSHWIKQTRLFARSRGLFPIVVNLNQITCLSLSIVFYLCLLIDKLDFCVCCPKIRIFVEDRSTLLLTSFAKKINNHKIITRELIIATNHLKFFLSHIPMSLACIKKRSIDIILCFVQPTKII